MASSEFSLVFLILAIILVLLKITQFLTKKLGLPKVAGEILLGIVLGPSVIILLALDGTGNTNLSKILNLSNDEITTAIEIIFFIAEFAVLLLLFEVGLEMDISALTRSGKSAVYASLGGVLLPFIGGFIIILLLTGQTGFIPDGVPVIDVALFFAATLTATSIGISISIFMELDQLHSPSARTMVGAAVIDDILAILLITLVLTYIEEETALGLNAIVEVITIFMSILGFFLITGLFGYLILPKIIRYLKTLNDRYLPLTLALSLMLFLSWLASFMHLAPIIGAFVAGVILNPDKQYARKMEEQLAPMIHWVIPIFFIAVGLRVNLRQVLTIDVLVIATVIVFLAITTKILGSGIGSLRANLSQTDSFLVGLAMSARGEVVLIFAAVALDLGIFSIPLYSSLILLVVTTSIIIPVILKYSFKHIQGEYSDLGNFGNNLSSSEIVQVD